MDWWLHSWMPRSMCGPWTDTLAVFYGFGHLAVFLAYQLIAAVLVYQGRRLRPRHRLFYVDRSFAALFAMCGIGHFLDFLSLWWVSYPMHATVVMITGCLAWVAVAAIPSLIFELSEPTKRQGVINQLEMIMRDSPQGAYMVDTEGITVWCNRSVERILGHEASNLVGRHQHSVLHYLRPSEDGTTWEPYPAEECSIYRAFRENRTQETHDDFLIGPNGKQVPVHLSSHPITDGAQQVLGALVVFTRRTAANG